MAEEKKTNAAPAKAATAVKKDDTQPGFFQKVGKWFREMKSELKKVIWPTPQALLKNSLVSLAFMLVSAACLGVFDWLAQKLVWLLFTLL